MALAGSELPGGGHGCGTLGVNLDLAPGSRERFAYILGVAEGGAPDIADDAKQH
jgi:hypothetical protein